MANADCNNMSGASGSSHVTRTDPSLKDIDLVSALANEGYVLRKTGKSWSGSNCPACGPSGKASSNKLSVFYGESDNRQRWSCLSCNARGDFADFLAHSRNVSMYSALKIAREMYLVGGVSNLPIPARRGYDLPSVSASISIEKDPKQLAAMAEVWRLLLLNGHTSSKEVEPYFKGRGISAKTLDRVVSKGMMRFLPTHALSAYRLLSDKVGKATLLSAGLWRDGAKWPAAAFRPIISLLPGGGSIELRLAKDPEGTEPKAVRYGSCQWPWFYREDPKRVAKKIYVVEGMIDLLSLLELGFVQFDDAIMAIPGTNSWCPEWFDLALLKNPNAEFLIATDRNAAGERVAEKMLSHLEGKTTVSRLLPNDGHSQDWNIFLCNEISKRAVKKAA